MNDAEAKSESAFRTIGELAQELGLPQHILRYWETRFPQLKPLQRAGNRRYYRPSDVALAKRIHRLLNSEGYTVKGVQKLLAKRSSEADAEAGAAAPAFELAVAPQSAPSLPTPDLAAAIRAVRSRLQRAIDADDIAARV